MKRVLLITVAALVTFSITQPAEAILTSVNDPVFGMDAITRDSDTGYEWLDVPLSDNLDYTYVSGQFGAGGAFEGFRYATIDEVVELWMNAGIPDINVGSTVANVTPVQDAINLLGTPPSQGLAGRTSTLGGVGRYYGALGLVTSNQQGAIVFQAYADSTLSVSDGYEQAGLGSYLLRETADNGVVPEPASLLLFGTGMAAAAGRRKWKK